MTDPVLSQLIFKLKAWCTNSPSPFFCTVSRNSRNDLNGAPSPHRPIRSMNACIQKKKWWQCLKDVLINSKMNLSKAYKCYDLVVSVYILLMSLYSTLYTLNFSVCASVCLASTSARAMETLLQLEYIWDLKVIIAISCCVTSPTLLSHIPFFLF